MTWANDDEIRRAIRNATATQRLEGIEVTAEEEELVFRHARGDISEEEFLRLALEHAKRVARES